MTGATTKEEIKMPSTSTPTRKTFEAVAAACGKALAQGDSVEERYVGLLMKNAVADAFASVAPRFDRQLFLEAVTAAFEAERVSRGLPPQPR